MTQEDMFASPFSLRIGKKLKREGMERAVDTRFTRLEEARDVVFLAALRRPERTATADDNHIDLGPAAGSLFKDGRWAFTGERINSARVTNHAREIKVWRLK